MDGLRILAKVAFEGPLNGQKFEPHPDPGYSYEGAEIAPVQPHQKPLQQKQFNLSEGMLGPWFQDVGPPKTSQPKVKVLLIERGQGGSLRLSQHCFTELFNAMRADPTVKYLLHQDYDGFHEFHGPGFLLTRFLGTQSYALLWTFDPASLITRSLYIPRQGDVFLEFCMAAQAYGKHVCSPWVLGFASCHLLLQLSDRWTESREGSPLRQIELRTGYGPHAKPYYPQQIMTFSHDIHTLTQWSQRVNEVAANIINNSRHQRTSKSILGLIVQEYRSGQVMEGIPLEMLDSHKASVEELGRAGPVLERQLDTYLEYLSYLHSRAERLSAVLFALLTHEDAMASVNLAAAAKRDSSSMKTVAIMTMAFLPATFFAALFAIPSLRWDQAVVVQDKFWVYWAFTLPSTAAVFLIWGVINNWKAWLSVFRRGKEEPVLKTEIAGPLFTYPYVLWEG